MRIITLALIILTLTLLEGCSSDSKINALLSGSSNSSSSAPAGPNPTPGPGTPPTPNPNPSPSSCTKYVDPNGTLGSASTRYSTIQKAVNALVPGDTLCVASGTYRETVMINKSGTSGNPITIRAYDSTKSPTIDGIVNGLYSLPAGGTTPSGCVETGQDRLYVSTQSQPGPTPPPVACTMPDYLSPQGYLVVIYASHIIWDGINVLHSRGGGLFVGEFSMGSPGFVGRVMNSPPSPTDFGVSDVVIKNAAIGHTRSMALNVFYAYQVTIDSIDEFDSNNYATFDRAGNSPYAWGNGLAIQGMNITVSNSKFHEQFSEPIQLGGFVTVANASETMYSTQVFRSAINVTLKGNQFYDNWALEGPYLGNFSNVTLDRNLIYSTGDTTYFRGNEPQICLAIDSESGINGGIAANGLYVTNNIIANCYRLVALQQFYSGSVYQNFNFYNNTLVNPYSGGQPLYNNMTKLTGFNFANNIVYAPGHSISSTFTAIPQTTSSNNIWSSSPSGTGLLGSGDIVLSNPTGTALLSSGSYHVTAGQSFDVSTIKLVPNSVAIGKGKPLTSVVTDYFGSPRPTSNPDIGAAQHQP